jgi:MoaA/NifB/PqqE/SkfB family radical SAM enzyme
VDSLSFIVLIILDFLFFIKFNKTQHYLRFVVEPFILQWCITNKCNLNCRHCYLLSKKGEVELFLLKEKLKEFKEWMEEWEMSSILRITGGEPLLHKDFFDILKYAAFLDLPVEVVTNGTLITPRVAKKFKNFNITKVITSIDGPK